MKIFSGSANKPLAEKVAKTLGLKLSSLETHVFPDGEKRIRVLERVLGEDCVVVQSTSTPADQNYMELFFIVDAVKRSGAKSVTAVIPYLGYQRQDHVFREGEAVSLEVVVRTLEAVGVDKLILFDLHSIKIPELFKIPVIHLSALTLFAQKIKDERWEKDSTVLVSPDMGGVRRIKILSEQLLGTSYAAVVKHRDLATGEVVAEKIEGSAGGQEKLKSDSIGLKKRALIVDDMISSGGTIVTSVNLLLRNGVEEIYVFATHPVFSDAAAEVLQKSGAKKVFVTDSIYVPTKKRFPKLEILSIAQMITEKLT